MNCWMDIPKIPNLKNIVEQRIPVRLEKTEIKLPRNREGKKEIIIEIEVREVLAEDKYHERIESDLEDKRGNIHYPYISYTPDHKTKRNFFASEQPGNYAATGKLILPNLYEKLKKEGKMDLPKKNSLSKLVEKIGLEKLNSEYGEKYFFLIVEDKRKKKNYTIWDTSMYVGFEINDNDKSKRVKNIELIQKKRSIENHQQFVRPKDIFTIIDSESLENSLKELVSLPLFYTGTEGDNVSSISIASLIKDNKENLEIKFPNDTVVKTIIVRENDELSLKNNQFTLIDKREKAKLQFSLDDINCIILENSHSRITSHLLSKLAENNISLIVTNEKCDPTAQLKKVENGDRTNREGAVAKYFFQKLYGKGFIRFADDNINRALNYGYKILTSAISRTLISYERENNLSSQIRNEIAKIIYYPVKINNLKTKVYIAIDIMVKSFISCLKENRVGKIKLPILLCQSLENEEIE
ncbi:2669_t:CDS:2 [Funneliformis geosporum]|uniref:2669_t:CDS:1 n=1 Tax=Funneliformis geosporum TaxID=1117311 RepID=A0A9W4WJ26_9GLOM|nr:2669_t:CDS:2 [Funneliformis geosporum]